MWAYRTRLMETDFFAAMLVPPFAPHPDWAEALAESLLQPDFPISMWEAFGRRLRRNYLWIFAVLACAWALKGYLHPTIATSWAEFISRSALGPVSGEVMLALGLVYNGIIFIIALATLRLQKASGEVLPKYHEAPILRNLKLEHTVTLSGPGQPQPQPLRKQRKQLVTMIVTDHPQQIADRIMKEMTRGVTALSGQGMYTHKEHSVLLVALTVTEAAQLKAMVSEIDAHAFMIVSPAQEVLGFGFQPLSKK